MLKFSDFRNFLFSETFSFRANENKHFHEVGNFRNARARDKRVDFFMK